MEWLKKQWTLFLNVLMLLGTMELFLVRMLKMIFIFSHRMLNARKKEERKRTLFTAMVQVKIEFYWISSFCQMRSITFFNSKIWNSTDFFSFGFELKTISPSRRASLTSDLLSVAHFLWFRCTLQLFAVDFSMDFQETILLLKLAILE